MRKGLLLCVFVSLLVFACGGSETQQKPVVTTTSFAYVSAPDADAKNDDGVPHLMQWLQDHPDKRIVSFSGVLSYREGVSGYVLYFVDGSNISQKFEIVPQRIVSLQGWKDAHPKAQVVAITAIPAYSGGVREYIICYE